MSIGRKLDVVRLDVAMYDLWVVAVEIFHHSKKLIRPCQDVRLGEWSLPCTQLSCQVIASDKLENERDRVAGDNNVLHSRKRRVDEALKNPGLTLCRSNNVTRLGTRRDHDSLERYCVVGLQVIG